MKLWVIIKKRGFAQNLKMFAFTRRFFSSNPAYPTASVATAEYISKRLSRAGYCSRRMAMKLLAEGRIRVNQCVITKANPTACPDDIVEVDQHVIPYVPPLADNEFPVDIKQQQQRLELPKHIQLYSIYKPARVICTNYDPKRRRTLLDYLNEDLDYKRQIGDHLPLHPIGRLDYQAEGLCLLATNGELKRRMEHPATKYRRTYLLHTRDPVSDDQMTKLKLNKDIRTSRTLIDRVQSAESLREYLSLAVHSNSSAIVSAGLLANNRLLMITMKDAHSNTFRTVLNEQGIVMDRLIRIGFGPYTLGTLLPGQLIRTKISNIPPPIKSSCVKK
jgi:23S rRNA pseudouridine2605 synthase